MEKMHGAPPTWKKGIVRHFIGIPIFFLIYFILALFYIYPHWPIDLIGWSILILVGILFSLAFEMVGLYVLTDRIGYSISHQKCSLLRIFISLMIFLSIIGLMGLFWLELAIFIRPHFT